MILINDSTVIRSFDDVLPGIADREEDYLRSLVTITRQSGLPLSLGMDELGGSLRFGSGRTDCLVMTPDNNRLKNYKTAHFVTPFGSNLRLGWYLVGADKATGLGYLGIGAASDTDVQETLALTDAIHNMVVMPAMQMVATSTGGGRGFFGS